MGIRAKLSPDKTNLEIRIDGRFDFSLHPGFRDSYQEVDPARTRILVDLSGTEYMDSSALGMLLVLRERAGGDRARITLRGARAGIQQILDVSRFGQLFTIE